MPWPSEDNLHVDVRPRAGCANMRVPCDVLEASALALQIAAIVEEAANLTDEDRFDRLEKMTPIHNRFLQGWCDHNMSSAADVLNCSESDADLAPRIAKATSARQLAKFDPVVRSSTMHLLFCKSQIS